MAVHESELRAHLRAMPQYDEGLITFIEPARGSDVGVADSLINVGNNRIVPLELKRGPSVVKELRPSQRAWHRLTISGGCRTYGLTLRADGLVDLFELKLADGLMSELHEVPIWRRPLYGVTFTSLAMGFDAWYYDKA